MSWLTPLARQELTTTGECEVQYPSWKFSGGHKECLFVPKVLSPFHTTTSQSQQLFILGCPSTFQLGLSRTPRSDGFRPLMSPSQNIHPLGLGWRPLAGSEGKDLHFLYVTFYNKAINHTLFASCGFTAILISKGGVLLAE